jgi:hypothetical protein
MNAIEILEKLAIEPNLRLSNFASEDIHAVEKEIQLAGENNPMLTIVEPHEPEPSEPPQPPEEPTNKIN